MIELTIRLVVSLAIVVGLLLLTARVGARRFKGANGSMVSVLHRQALSRTSSVAVVEVGQRVLVLGSTEHSVNLIAELDPDELAGATADLGEVIDLDEVRDAHEPADPGPAPVVRRRGGAHAAPRTPASPGGGGLSGSVLSPDTWRQAMAAARGGHG